MKNSLFIAVALVITLFLANCDFEQYRGEAVGAFGDVIVIMDSTRYESQTAEAIRSTFGRYIYTIPDAPRRYDLRFRSFATNSQLERLQQFKNIIIAAPIDAESNAGELIRTLLGQNAEQAVRAGNQFAFIRQGVWYDNQWVLILTAPSDEALASRIQQEGERLTESLLQKELQRWIVQVYDRGEQFEIEEHLWQDYGWMIRVKHDWYSHLDTTYVENGTTKHFFTLQRITRENDRRFWAWWVNQPVDLDTLTVEGIYDLRDQITRQWIRGSEPNAYSAIEFRRPVITDTLTIDGHTAYETLGTWRLVNAAMGGPFVNMLIYDEETERLFMLEFFQFAPDVDQRPYVRQFRAMLRTFESDSTFSATE